MKTLGFIQQASQTVARLGGERRPFDPPACFLSLRPSCQKSMSAREGHLLAAYLAHLDLRMCAHLSVSLSLSTSHHLPSTATEHARFPSGLVLRPNAGGFPLTLLAPSSLPCGGRTGGRQARSRDQGGDGWTRPNRSRRVSHPPCSALATLRRTLYRRRATSAVVPPSHPLTHPPPPHAHPFATTYSTVASPSSIGGLGLHTRTQNKGKEKVSVCGEGERGQGVDRW